MEEEEEARGDLFKSCLANSEEAHRSALLSSSFSSPSPSPVTQFLLFSAWLVLPVWILFCLCSRYETQEAYWKAFDGQQSAGRAKTCVFGLHTCHPCYPSTETETKLLPADVTTVENPSRLRWKLFKTV